MSEGQQVGTEGQPNKSEGQLAGFAGQPRGWTVGLMDKRTNEQAEFLPKKDGRGHMDGRNFSPFYRTLSPLGAAAMLPSATSKQQSSRARESLTI